MYERMSKNKFIAQEFVPKDIIQSLICADVCRFLSAISVFVDSYWAEQQKQSHTKTMPFKWLSVARIG